MTTLKPFEIHAQNLPEHSRNAIHTDAGAQAAGFPRALVAGVTTYAYLCHVPLAAHGIEWLTHGGGEVRFRRPVFDGDLLRCTPIDEHTVAAEVVAPHEDDATHAQRAIFTVMPDLRHAPWLPTPPNGSPAPRQGEPLRPIELRLEGEWGGGYAHRAGDPLPLCLEAGVVHPAVWPALANHAVHTQVARGSWVHLRSRIQHLATVREGSDAVVTGSVVNRWITFDARGNPRDERAVLDVQISVGGMTVAWLEHEAIVAYLSTN